MILTVCRTADQSTLKTTNETLLRHRFVRRRLDDYGRNSEAELRWWSTVDTHYVVEVDNAGEKYLRGQTRRRRVCVHCPCRLLCRVDRVARCCRHRAKNIKGRLKQKAE